MESVRPYAEEDFSDPSISNLLTSGSGKCAQHFLPYALQRPLAGDIFGLAFPLKIFTVPQMLDSMLPDLSHIFPRGVVGSDAYNASHPRPGLLFAWWSIASECAQFPLLNPQPIALQLNNCAL
jgi:hypothetical protein